jgi:hypothetical protein
LQTQLQCRLWYSTIPDNPTISLEADSALADANPALAVEEREAIGMIWTISGIGW